jgi:hypothetical protein
MEVSALVEQVQIELAQHSPEGIRILGLLHRRGPLDPQQIGRRVGDWAFEQARLHLGQRSERGTIDAAQHLDRLRARQIGTDGAALGTVMRPQHAERIAMTRRHQRLDLAAVELRSGHFVHTSLRAVLRRRLAMRASPLTGTTSQFGRLAAS